VATVNDCKHAQQGLKDALWDLAEVGTVGITAKDGNYFFKVNVEVPVDGMTLEALENLPTEWQGIPVVYHTIGL
jgi:hypothetical protein